MTTKRKRTRRSTDRGQIVADLARYLVNPPQGGQPLVIRSQLARTGGQHLTVIWDRWRGMPLSERSAIIVEANDSLPEGVRADLVFAIGRTMEEAIALGYFPYRIAPPRRRIGDDERDRIEAALRDEGAIETGEGLQLRFSTLEAAQDACHRLQQRVPGPYWTVVEEVRTEG